MIFFNTVEKKLRNSLGETCEERNFTTFEIELAKKLKFVKNAKIRQFFFPSSPCANVYEDLAIQWAQPPNGLFPC